MPYTSDEELLHDRIEAALEKIKDVKAAMEARLENHEQWSRDHLLALKLYVQDTNDYMFKLRTLQSNTR